MYEEKTTLPTASIHMLDLKLKTSAHHIWYHRRTNNSQEVEYTYRIEPEKRK